MSNPYMSFLNPPPVPQTQPLAENQVLNNAGGYVYKISDEQRVLRFIIIGSDSPTYYCTEKKMTEDNAKDMIRIIKEGVVNVLQLIEATSLQGRAPRQTSTLFLMALVCTYATPAVKSHAYVTIKYICRTGTQLFQFVAFVNEMRGWSEGLRRGVADFYEDKSLEKLAMQILKYRQREGWTHRDVLRLSHPKIKDKARNDVLRYAVGKDIKEINKGRLIKIFEALQTSKQEEGISPVIEVLQAMVVPWEFLPTWTHAHVELWQTLLPSMGYTAMLRNLTRMAALGMFKSNLAVDTKTLINRIMDSEKLKKERVHPIQIFFALHAYHAGKNMRHADKTWNPQSAIEDALNYAFIAAFGNVKPTGKNIMVALDVSGSMWSAMLANSQITAAEMTGALALVLRKTEPYCQFVAFSGMLVEFPIYQQDGLQQICERMRKLSFTQTDCSLPVIAAIENKLPVDAFIILTDSETYAGRVHVSKALQMYRQVSGIPAKMIVVGMTATEFTVADPNDSLSLDVVGADSSLPALITEFIGVKEAAPSPVG